MANAPMGGLMGNPLNDEPQNLIDLLLREFFRLTGPWLIVEAIEARHLEDDKYSWKLFENCGSYSF